MILFYIALETSGALDDKEKEEIGLIFEETHKMTSAIICEYLNLNYGQNRGVVDDLTQDVYLKVIRYKERYIGKSEKVKLGNLIMMIRNVCFNYMKRTGIISFTSLTEFSENDNGEPIGFEVADEADLLATLVRSDTLEHVRKSIDSLPSPTKEIIIERFYMNKSYEEIAELYQLKKGTVGSIIHRGLKSLGKELKDYVENDI